MGIASGGMNAPHATFGPMLRAHRAARALSQERLADRAEVSPRHLSCLETGRAAPSRIGPMATLSDTTFNRLKAMLAESRLGAISKLLSILSAGPNKSPLALLIFGFIFCHLSLRGYCFMANSNTSFSLERLFSKIFVGFSGTTK